MKKNTSKSVVVKGTPNHPTPSNNKSLTPEEQQKLNKLEDQISENMLSSFKLAAALNQIRDGKLYRAEFATFEEYCKKRWEYSRSYCQRLADMHEVLKDLKEYEGDKTFPRNELQARVFVPLKSKDQRIKLLEKVSQESESDTITASEFAKFRRQLWPEEFAAQSKPVKSKVVAIDVPAEIETLPPLPSIIKTVDAAKELLDELVECDGDDSPLGNSLREFIKASEPVLKWEKEKTH